MEAPFPPLQTFFLVLAWIIHSSIHSNNPSLNHLLNVRFLCILIFASVHIGVPGAGKNQQVCTRPLLFHTA